MDGFKGLEKSKPKTILLVDDDKDHRNAIASLLRHKGLLVQEAASGNEAYKLATQSEFDFVLTDMQMPDGSGDILLDRLVQLRPAPMVMVMTGHSAVSREEAIARGAVAYFDKPLNFKELMSILAK
jgi:CheY-like chemotaxis protein